MSAYEFVSVSSSSAPFCGEGVQFDKPSGSIRQGLRFASCLFSFQLELRRISDGEESSFYESEPQGAEF